MRTDRAILSEYLTAMGPARPHRGKLAVEGRLAVELPATIQEQVGLRIVFPYRYSLRPPSAFILGDVFGPRDRSRHFMDDGSCCLFLPGVDEAWNPDDPFTLSAWLDQVILFVARQMIFDRLGRWPGDEWQHGFAAYDQHVRETLGDDLASHFYEHRRHELRRDQPCPCGAAQIFGSCHREAFEGLKFALSGRRNGRVRSHDARKLDG